MGLRYFDKRLRNVHAGIIDEYVESVESIECGRQLRAVGDITDEDFRAPASVDDFRLNFFKFASRSAEEEQLGSRLSQSERRDGAKTTAGAGHQRNQAVEPEGFRNDRCTMYRGYGLSPEVATTPS